MNIWISWVNILNFNLNISIIFSMKINYIQLRYVFYEWLGDFRFYRYNFQLNTFQAAEKNDVFHIFDKIIRFKLGIIMVLDTFPKAFFQVENSKWQLLKCVISQAATSQKLGTLGNGDRSLQGWVRGPSAADRTCLRPSAAARTDLGSCRLKNCTFGKLPLGKNSLGKYLTSF